MILNVTLTNFRQHKNLNVDFSDGVTVVRGENEGGKTTRLEKIEEVYVAPKRGRGKFEIC